MGNMGTAAAPPTGDSFRASYVYWGEVWSRKRKRKTQRSEYRRPLGTTSLNGEIYLRTRLFASHTPDPVSRVNRSHSRTLATRLATS
jgi:hypothetical protein